MKLFYFFRVLITVVMFIPCFTTFATTNNTVIKIYKITLKQEINSSAFKIIKDGLNDALKQKADFCIIDINTYGGAVDAADSIRGAIIRYQLPVIAFINTQAVSAGALISISCDSVYMRKGSSFGAATVVDQTGAVMPDKYQSFMRAMMRSTAESHGKKIVVENGETKEVWYRDPKIAQAMVSKDSVLSFTPMEAIKHGYCEGMADNITEVITQITGDKEYVLIEQEISILQKIVLFLMSPFIQGILLMLIIAGLYFEIQSPGIGLPLAAAITGAVFYFAPLYLEGLAQNWELFMFIVGVGLLFAEIFVIPGFGVAGISGIILVLFSLTFAMIDNNTVFNGGDYNIKPIIQPLALVLISTTSSFFISIFLASKLYGTKAFSKIILHTSLANNKGFVGIEQDSLQTLVGEIGIVTTDLKPQGTIEIHSKRYQAQLEYGYANKGEKVTIVKVEGGRLFVNRLL
ncbi:MAG: NfeD family protein [Bacteroidales bacterium]